ncbi:MAG: anti-sigma factor family protein [Desulfomonilaceae bacterium]
MRHIDYQKRISLLLDGVLEKSSEEELCSHLEKCAECMHAYKKMVSLNETLGNLKPLLPDDSLANKIRAQIAAEPEPRVRGGWWSFSLLKQVPAWALIAILAVGVGDMAGRILTEALSVQDMSHSLENLIQDQGESLTDLVINFGQSENGR